MSAGNRASAWRWSWPSSCESLRAFFYAPFYGALAREAFSAEGVEIRFTSSPRPQDAALRLMDGTVDVCWGGPMRVMETYQQVPGCDIVCFAEVVTRDPFLLLGREARPTFTLADLKSVRLATVSEVPTPWLCLQHDLRLTGIDPASIARVADQTMARNGLPWKAVRSTSSGLQPPACRSAKARRMFGTRRPAAAPRPHTLPRRGTPSPREELAHGAAIHRTENGWRASGRGSPGIAATSPIWPRRSSGGGAPQAALSPGRHRCCRAPATTGCDGLVSGGFPGATFETAVDNELAAAVVAEQLAALGPRNRNGRLAGEFTTGQAHAH